MKKSTLTLLLLSFFYSIPGPKAPLVILINHKTYSATAEADCKQKQSSNENTACECCLLYNYANNPQESAQNIVDGCTKKSKSCSEKSITALKKDKKLHTNASSQDLLEALYEDVIIRPMNVDPALLGQDGQFTEKTIVTFLTQAYKEKKLPYAEFKKPECLKVKDIAQQGGYNTLQLFRVTSTCSTGPASVYILKESRDGVKEAKSLKAIERVPQFKNIIAPKTKPGLPSLSLPIAYFSYPDKKTVHYLSTMPSAKGTVLSNLAIEYQKNRSAQNEEGLKRAFFILGKELSNFHKLFMDPKSGKIFGLTVAHGDFHLHNIFFDPLTGHCIFIDNETIELYLKNKIHPSIDICKPFYMPFNNQYYLFLHMIEGIDLADWYDITLKNFLLGYASTYPKEQQNKVLSEMKEMFNTFQIPDWIHFDNIDAVRSKIINPIFDGLMKGKKA